jgi:flagellar FliL protein
VADEEKKPEADKKDEKPKSKSKLILIVAVVIVILAGAGGGFFFLKKGSSEPVDAAGETATPEAHGAEAKPQEQGGEKHAAPKTEAGTGAILDLDPFIVNLADTPEIRYLKVTIKLELTSEDHTEEVNARMAQIRDSLLILLSSKEYASIRTVEGKLELRDEILQRLNTILKKGVVRTAYFTDFVAQ